MERIDHAAYYHAKNSCYTCLNPNDLVDTGIIIEGEGVLALCRSCVADAAHKAGFVLSDNAAEVESLKAQLAGATLRADEAEDMIHKLKVYENRVENLKTARDALPARS
jgi:hypothetical protein